MGLESVTYINDLVTTNPTSTDPKSQGDDHIRNIKTALIKCILGFPGSVIVAGTDGGAADAYTLTPSKALPAYSNYMLAIFSPIATNTTASTLDISSLGAKNIKAIDGADLIPSDLEVGSVYIAVYNGTEFRLLSPTKTYIDNLLIGTAYPASVVDTNKFLRYNGSGYEWSGLTNIDLATDADDAVKLSLLHAFDYGD